VKAVVIHAPQDLRLDGQTGADLEAGQVRIGVAYGGICGSDLHYFHDGGFGAVRISEPMILGHEVSGVIEELGPGVTNLCPGDRVAINPSRPCGRCDYCLRGMPTHCLDMRFYGSAMRTPHIQGAFRQSLIADASQCFPVGDDISLQVAALAEPFSVALHAMTRAGSLTGKRVLVTGCGPIGALVAVAARRNGALSLTVTDILDEPLDRIADIVADQVVNVSCEPEVLSRSNGAKGQFDVMFEASGNEAAIRTGIEWLRPGGVLVQVGTGDDVALPLSVVVAKEIDLRGSFRFHEEFAWAARLLASAKLPVEPLISDVLPLERAEEAFRLASDRSKAMKVQIAFS